MITLDLSKVKPEASKYLIERWQFVIATQNLTPEQLDDLQNHIDAHRIHLGLPTLYQSFFNKLKLWFKKHVQIHD